MSKALLLKNTTLLQLYSRAQAPSRDYYGLTIAESCICFNIWRVTRGPHALPRQKFIEVEDFKYDKYLQDDIKNSFGPNVYEYVLNLSNKKRAIESMPRKVFMNIIKYLSVNDVFRLSRINKIFYELCNTDHVWEAIFGKILGRKPSSDEKKAALDFGWKEALKRRLVYVRRAAASRALKSQIAVAPPSRSVRPTVVKKSSSSMLSKKTLVRAK